MMILNIENLLLPVAETSPCGDELSFSNEFHEIKKARTQDDPLLEQGEWIQEPKQANWSLVADQSTLLFKERTKDIRLLNWLTEALSHLYGFEGLAQGLMLSCRTLELYWQEIHPIIEDEDIDQRLGLIQGMIQQIIPLLKLIPLSQATSIYTLLEYENILYAQNTSRKNIDSVPSDETERLVQFEKAMAAIPTAYRIQNLHLLDQIMVTWKNLRTVLDLFMGVDAPSFSGIDSQLNELQKTLRKVYKQDELLHIPFPKEANSPVQSSDFSPPTDPEANSRSSSMTASFQPDHAADHLHNRTEAIRILQRISDYFQHHEPHSPVSYMLNRTIKWSQMPLHEWLNQVIKNDQPLESIHELLGIQQNTDE